MSEGWVLRTVRDLAPREVDSTGLRLSAVLMLLRPSGTGPEDFDVVFTRRSAELPSHAGQVSFPGGRLEEGESPWEAALRETREELGIDTEGVECVGQLDELITISDYHVTPFVGLVRGEFEYEPDEREVARVFHVPLSALLLQEAWEMHEHTYQSRQVQVWYFNYDGEVIWGVTGEILRGLLGYLWKVRP
ncbi:MAG: CoA pyrophosphatase [Myxococcota bacterium]|nr:CoA pyrophosphatase [Myxococcota bacterium]